MEQYGLPDNCVRIRPDNCTDDAEKGKFGLSLLGGYVGHPGFIQAGLQEKIEQLTEEMQHLIQYGHMQNRFVLLLRSSPHDYTSRFHSRFCGAV